MANEKVSELPPLLNLQDDDLIEITKYMGVGLGDDGGDYKSYQMAWADFKLFTYSGVIPIGIQKLGEITSSYTTGTLLTNSAIIEIHIKVVSGTPTLKIGSTSGGAEIMPETEALTGNNYLFPQSPCYDAITIYPRVTGAGTINVTIILRQGLFG